MLHWSAVVEVSVVKDVDDWIGGEVTAVVDDMTVVEEGAE